MAGRPPLLTLPSLTALRLWAALLLAAVGLQAAQPFHAPLEVRHGSAFSAATADVAVAPQRRIEVQRALPAMPAPPPVAVEHALVAPAFLPETPSPRPDSTGPPARVILARQPAPRGPPIA